MFVASVSANFAFAISTPTAHPRESIAVASET
jgi:hypothetical protein